MQRGKKTTRDALFYLVVLADHCHGSRQLGLMPVHCQVRVRDKISVRVR